MYYTVYKHIFPNGKVYIGITSNDVIRRWQRGWGYEKQSLVYNAIKKYGWDNIKHEILFKNLSKREAEIKEIEEIKRHKSDKREFGYNVDIGGNTYGKHSLETIEKIREKLKGRTFTEETKKRMSESAKKKRLSLEHKKHIGDANRGEKCKWYGKHLSAERKKQISDRFAKQILCVETGRNFKTFLQIQKELGIDRNCVSRCIKGVQNTAGSYHWEIKENKNV